VDMSPYIASYKRKRDMVVAGLAEAGYKVAKPGGAFYVFPEVPALPSNGGATETGSQFVARAIAKELLVIPGNIFSVRDTNFRISYAASDATIERGLKVRATLNR